MGSSLVFPNENFLIKKPISNDPTIKTQKTNKGKIEGKFLMTVDLGLSVVESTLSNMNDPIVSIKTVVLSIEVISVVVC